MPAGVAVKTAVVTAFIGLETLRAASWANAAPVEPVAIGVEAVLDIIFVNNHAVLLGNCAGMAPGGNLEMEKLDIGAVGVVPKQGMAGLVQQ